MAEALRLRIAVVVPDVDVASGVPVVRQLENAKALTIVLIKTTFAYDIAALTQAPCPQFISNPPSMVKLWPVT